MEADITEKYSQNFVFGEVCESANSEKRKANKQILSISAGK